MDGVQPEVWILAELIDQRSAGLLQRHGDGTPAETMVQRGGPLRKLLRSLLQFPAFAGLGAGHQQLPTMPLIGPIDSHKSRKIRLGRFSIHELRHGSNPPFSQQAAWLRRKAYSGVWNQTSPEYSSGSQGSPLLERPAESIACWRAGIRSSGTPARLIFSTWPWIIKGRTPSSGDRKT